MTELNECQRCGKMTDGIHTCSVIKPEIMLYKNFSGIEFYKLRLEDNYVWLANEESEGIGISYYKLYDIFHKYFQENH